MITIEQLFQSYGSYLRAKVQEREFMGWGGVVADTFRKEIADHQELEAQYLKELAVSREADADALKAKLDAFDAKQKPRRLR